MLKQNKDFERILGELFSAGKTNTKYSSFDLISEAERFESENNSREALYFYEETLDASRKEMDSERENSVIEKIGNILNSRKTFKDAKIFYNIIFYNRSSKIDFSCQSSSECCKSLLVNVTVTDILRILENRSDLKIDDFVSFGNDLLDNEEREDKKWLFFLKKQEGKSDCIFLENSICKIHSFKPFTCRNFPMSINFDDRITYKKGNFIEDKCHYCIEPDINDENKIKRELREITNNMHADSYASSGFNKKQKNQTSLTTKEKSKYMLNFVKEHNDYEKEIARIIQKNNDVVKITSYYPLTSSPGNIFPIGIFSTEDLQELNKWIIENITQIPHEKIQIHDNNIEFIINNDFQFNIFLYKTEELNSLPPINEKILFENESFVMGKKSFFPPVYQNNNIYTQIIKATKNVFRGAVKNNNEDLYQEVLKNLELLVNQLLPFPEKKEILTELRKSVFDCQEFKLFESENINREDLEKFDKILEKNIKEYPEISFGLQIKKLSISEHLEQTEKSCLLLEKIIDSADDIFKMHKITKVISTDKKYTERCLKKIFSMLFNLSQIEIYNFIIEKAIKHIRLFIDFFEIYQPEDLKRQYYESLLELGKIYLKKNYFSQAGSVFSLIENKAVSYNSYFDLLFLMGDEYNDENQKEKAVYYFNKALEHSSEKQLHERVIILEVIIDLCIETKKYDKANYFIKNLISISEKNNLPEKKLFSLVKKAKVNSFSSNRKKINPIKEIEKLASEKNLDLAILTYILNNLNNKLIVLPLKMNGLGNKFKFLDLVEKEDKSDESELVLNIVGLLSEYFITNLQVVFADFLFKQNLIYQNQKIIHNFVTAKILEEFKNYSEAVKSSTQLCEEFSLIENHDPIILKYLKTYTGYLIELDNKAEEAKEIYSSLLNNFEDYSVKFIFDLANFKDRIIKEPDATSSKIVITMLKSIKFS